MSLVVPVVRSRTKTLLPVKGNPLTDCELSGGGVGSTGLLVRSVRAAGEGQLAAVGTEDGPVGKAVGLQTVRRCRDERGRGRGEVSDENVVRRRNAVSPGWSPA